MGTPFVGASERATLTASKPKGVTVMSANEIANHIEAACWLKFGPGDPDVRPVPLYFRSQNGFINTVGVLDSADPMATPLVFVQLDRYYSRNEVSINAFIPAVLDGAATPPDPPDLVGYPASSQIFQPIVQTWDSRFIYDGVPFPPADLTELDKFNGFIVIPTVIGIEGAEPTFADICLQVIRVPRGNNGAGQVTYRTMTVPSP